MSKVKRCIIMCLCIILFTSVFAACTKEAEVYTAKEITDEIKTYNDTNIVWTNLRRDDIPAYFGFSSEKVKDLSVYINDNDENYDIAAAFEFESGEDMLSVIEALNKSLTAAADSFKNTSLTESQKIGNRLVLKKDNMLVVVVSNNYEKINGRLAEKGFISVEK